MTGATRHHLVRALEGVSILGMFREAILWGLKTLLAVTGVTIWRLPITAHLTQVSIDVTIGTRLESKPFKLGRPARRGPVTGHAFNFEMGTFEREFGFLVKRTLTSNIANQIPPFDSMTTLTTQPKATFMSVFVTVETTAMVDRGKTHEGLALRRGKGMRF